MATVITLGEGGLAGSLLQRLMITTTTDRGATGTSLSPSLAEGPHIQAPQCGGLGSPLATLTLYALGSTRWQPPRATSADRSSECEDPHWTGTQFAWGASANGKEESHEGSPGCT